MNFLILSDEPRLCAEYHSDVHLNSQLKEAVQVDGILSRHCRRLCARRGDETMTTIPDYFLDELIYKNYENRSRDTFRLDPQPCRLTALYAELLHVTIAQRQLWSANLACSFEPFSWLCDEDDLLIAVAILVSQGKLIVDKPVEKYERRKTESAVGGYYYPLETIKVLWVEHVSNDAFWRAWGKGLAVSKRWNAGHDRMKALAQLALWEDKRTEATNMIAAWKRRLRGDEDAIAQATIHPHLVDACNPSPESDAP